MKRLLIITWLFLLMLLMATFCQKNQQQPQSTQQSQPLAANTVLITFKPSTSINMIAIDWNYDYSEQIADSIYNNAGSKTYSLETLSDSIMIMYYSKMAWGELKPCDLTVHVNGILKESWINQTGNFEPHYCRIN